MEKTVTYACEGDAGWADGVRDCAAEPGGSVRSRNADRAGAKGALHELDARVKIALLVAYSAALFGSRSLVGLGVAAALLAAVMLAGRVPVARLLREGAFTCIIVGFLFFYNVVASGWLAGAALAARLLLLVGASLLLMALSTPTELSEGLRRLLTPLGRLGLPVRDFSTSLAIALRFMPLLAEELGAVRAAQASRGAPFAHGGLVCRLRAYGGLMVPLFVGLFRRADRLAVAMDARCFGAAVEPTQLAGRRFGARDGAALFVGLAACVAFALL